jgi:hypothetical protein
VQHFQGIGFAQHFLYCVDQFHRLSPCLLDDIAAVYANSVNKSSTIYANSTMDAALF